MIYTSQVWVCAQHNDPKDIDIQEFIEHLYQIPDEDINYEDQYETLYQLYTNPINLNATNENELSSLFQLSTFQLNHLMDYLDQNAPLLSIYELQVVEGFDRSTIESLLPFVEVRSPGDFSTKGHLLQRIASEENNYLILRTERVLEKQEGYQRNDSSQYLGSPYKIYGRFRSSHSKDFSIGLTFEKDAGEQFTFSPAQKQYGFDYYSFHFFLENKRDFKRIALGDYQLQFGQGLVLGAGFNQGKGAETITSVRRSNLGLRPYTSALESNYMRGAAFTYKLNKWSFTPFYSRLNQDGVIRSGDYNGNYEEYITSIQDIGMHRTYAELAARKGIQEESYGINITYDDLKHDGLQLGLTYLQNNFSVPIQKTPNNYNQFEFHGHQNHSISLFANYNWQNFLLFSEIARSKSGGTATVAGFIGSLTSLVSISMHLRNYAKDFHSFYGNSLGEGSHNINETGIYWGIKMSPFKRVALAAYYDHFKFPWLRFGVDSPSNGYEYLLRADYRPSRKINLYAQWREQMKEVSTSSIVDNLNRLSNGVKRTLLFNLDFIANKMLTLKSRVQFSSFDLNGLLTKGMAIIQDFNLKISKFMISSRIAIFDTEDYTNRQYAFERDVLYVSSVQAYANQGIRNYILLHFKPTKNLSIWTKYGRFHYRNANDIGSGLNRISGRRKSELKIQVRIKF